MPAWLVGRLRLGAGHASTVRPDPSTRASWEIEAPTTRVTRDPFRHAAAIEPTTGQARQVLSHRLHELGLSGRKLAKVDKLRRNVHLGVCGPRRVVPGVMHGPTGDPTGLADELGVLLADISRLGLGPGEVVVDLLLDSAECFGESDASPSGSSGRRQPEGGRGQGLAMPR